jgi:hypothetical protein
MNAPILIVRTVSVEKLSPVLDACRAQWPEHPLFVVTTAARAGELRADPRIAEVISHGGAVGGGFDAPIASEHALEAVVVPVANRGGSGYANVLQACRNLRARTWFLARYSRELVELSARAWTWRARRERLLEPIAHAFGWLWTKWILRVG